MKVGATGRAEVHASLTPEASDKALRGNVYSRAYMRPETISATYERVDGEWSLRMVIVMGTSTQDWAPRAPASKNRAQWSENGRVGNKVVGEQHLANAPEWVRAFVNDNRPGGTE